METETKAITFKLSPLTKSKQHRLEMIADEFNEIYNFASMRLPSLQTIIQSKSRTPIEAIRKDLKSTIKLHSQIVQEAIECARMNYQAILASGDCVTPKLTQPIIRLHNQAWEFRKHNNTTYLVIPAEKKGSRYTPLWIPIKYSEYYNDIIANNQAWGVGQINLKNQTFATSIKTPKTIVDYIPETFIGIDLGLNNLATLAVINNNKYVLTTKFWNGKETRHIRNRFHNYRSEVSKIGRKDLVMKTKGYESNWMKNANHNISKQIIEITKQYSHPVIVMEDLHKFTNLRWNFYQLRQMILYKAEYAGIKTQLVNPKNTSITCYKCGHIDKSNRNGLSFKCVSCGNQIHADLNAAINIALSQSTEVSKDD